MFCVEWGTNTNKFKNHIIYKGNIPPALGWSERFMGVIFWPVCLGIFLYHFIKNLLK